MKIGILTFHRAHNFGAFLQAFALKTFLEEKGHEVELVDYWPKEHAALYRFFYKEEVKSFKGFLRECVVAYYRKNKAKAFINAQKKMNVAGKMKVTHVNESVMEIFEITGFTTILTIE